MASGRDGALLAHISDSVTELSEHMEEHRGFQRNVLAVLNQVLAANEAQSEMLTEILSAAQQEPGPSPVAQALEALVSTVRQLADNQATLIGHVAEMPEAIARQIAIAMGRSVEAETEDA